MPETTVTPRLLTEAEAAKFLGVSRQFLRKSRMDGHRTGHADAPLWVKSGRMIRYAIEDLDRWISDHRQSAPGGTSDE